MSALEQDWWGKETPPEAEVLDEAPPYAFTTGGSFILDTPADPEPLCGSGGEVLLADGEALIIAGGQGLRKTTLAQQLALGRCGFGEYAELLGWPIKPGEARVLYLAMDRPRQAARSFRRMVGDSWRRELDERLVVWQGPPPADLAKHVGLLLDLCRKADADTVVVDSLKDAAVGLTDDEVGRRTTGPGRPPPRQASRSSRITTTAIQSGAQEPAFTASTTSTGAPRCPRAPGASCCSQGRPVTPSSDCTT